MPIQGEGLKYKSFPSILEALLKCMFMKRAKIIGNGLIAKSFADVLFDNELVLFASGVSFSGETRISEFARERSLLKKVMAENCNLKLVYFSSTNVALGNKTDYINHKRDMEMLVKKHKKEFYIFQLPQVVGVVNNNTLVSYLIRMLLSKKTLDIQLNAKRNLIGVGDLVRVIQYLVNSGHGLNSVQVIASGSNACIIDIVKEIASILDRQLNLCLHEYGDDQSVSIDFLQTVLKPEDPLLHSDYYKNVLRYYVPRIVEGFRE